MREIDSLGKSDPRSRFLYKCTSGLGPGLEGAKQPGHSHSVENLSPGAKNVPGNRASWGS